MAGVILRDMNFEIGTEVLRSSLEVWHNKARTIERLMDSVKMLSRHCEGFFQIQAYQFSQMVKREQEHRDMYCCYHSYSHAALIYETQAVIAAGLFGELKSRKALNGDLIGLICSLARSPHIPDRPRHATAHPPLLRLLRKPYIEEERLHGFGMGGVLKDWFGNGFQGNDHDPRYRQMVICGSFGLVTTLRPRAHSLTARARPSKASNALFSSNTEAPPTCVKACSRMTHQPVT